MNTNRRLLTPAAHTTGLEQRARVLVAGRNVSNVTTHVDAWQAQRHCVGRSAQVARVAVSELTVGTHACIGDAQDDDGARTSEHARTRAHAHTHKKRTLKIALGATR